HLSRPIRLTDAAKVTAWAVEWLPWGGVHAITGSETLNARFPGQWFQVESGLHYNWHRHYDPTIGRYTQPDPLGFVDGPSVYAYAKNAPHEYVDPDGRNKLADLWNFVRRLRFEGPDTGYAKHGTGRICQIRSGEWFVRLDQDRYPGQSEPTLHLNIGSSKPGRWQSPHIPLNPRKWF
ncbi:MAG: RHS repeat-associated core domain-containing protein, partial [Hyphomicrobium sp.]